MRFLVLTLVFCAGVTFGYKLPDGRIVGGEPTTIEEYPGIVQSQAYSLVNLIWSHSCAANVLTSRYLVSAAHCFTGATFDIRNRRILAGTTHRNTGGYVVYIVRAINHPSYGTPGRGYDGDISVLLLASSLVFSAVVQPVAIPAPNSELIDNSPVVHVGWGTTTQGGSVSPVLRDVTIYTINRQLCADRYRVILPNLPVTENMICAGILDVGGKDACQGDSGGPLYHGKILVGVVSWGHGCANETYPGLSTAVSPYTRWILETAV